MKIPHEPQFKPITLAVQARVVATRPERWQGRSLDHATRSAVSSWKR